MAWKDRISSPLEAGVSILDDYHLPAHLSPALEYASAKLASKSLHLTLVVVRRDYQLPSVVPPLGSPGLLTPTTPASPLLSRFSSATMALKQFVRTATRHGMESMPQGGSRSAVSSPCAALESPGLLRRWPLSPATPSSPPPPPLTPCTPSSVTDYNGNCPVTPGASGVRLVHAPDLSSKDQRLQRAVFARTAQKFDLGSSLAPALHPSTLGLTSQLITNSLVQNEVLFSSDGLTLLSLDGLYSLKSALSSYSKTKSPLRLEDAVDELRRYVLANNGAKVTRSDLMRSYDWMSVSCAAVLDLDRMYKRAYGGPDGIGAISGLSSGVIMPEPVIRSDEDDGSVTEYEDDGDLSPADIGLAVTMIEVKKPPPSPKGPVLKIQTNFGMGSALRSRWGYDEDENGENSENSEAEEDGDETARPCETLPMGFTPWSASIDHVLSAGASPVGPGPMTPKGYDDISPITRGEWGFLMVDDAFQGGRTVRVETC